MWSGYVCFTSLLSDNSCFILCVRITFVSGFVSISDPTQSRLIMKLNKGIFPIKRKRYHDSFRFQTEAFWEINCTDAPYTVRMISRPCINYSFVSWFISASYSNLDVLIAPTYILGFSCQYLQSEKVVCLSNISILMLLLLKSFFYVIFALADIITIEARTILSTARKY